MKNFWNYIVILIIVIGIVSGIGIFTDISPTGMATGDENNAGILAPVNGEESTAAIVSTCSSPCYNEQYGVETMNGDCISVNNFISGMYCCFDDDCPEGYECYEGQCSEKVTRESVIVPIRDEGVPNHPAEDRTKVNLVFVKTGNIGENKFKQQIKSFLQYLWDKEPFSDNPGYKEKFSIFYSKNPVEFDKTGSLTLESKRSAFYDTDFYKNYYDNSIFVIVGGNTNQRAIQEVIVVSNPQTFLHELGHALFGLSDEYVQNNEDFNGIEAKPLYFMIEGDVQNNLWESDNIVKTREKISGVEYYKKNDKNEIVQKNGDVYIEGGDNIMNRLSPGLSYGKQAIKRINYVMKQDDMTKAISEAREFIEKIVAGAPNDVIQIPAAGSKKITRENMECSYTGPSGPILSELYMLPSGELKYFEKSVCDNGCQVCAYIKNGESIFISDNNKQVIDLVLNNKDYTTKCIESSGNQGLGDACARDCQCGEFMVCKNNKCSIDTDKIKENIIKKANSYLGCEYTLFDSDSKGRALGDMPQPTYPSCNSVRGLTCARFVDSIFLYFGLDRIHTNGIDMCSTEKTTDVDSVKNLRTGDIFVSTGSTEAGHTGIYLGMGFVKDSSGKFVQDCTGRGCVFVETKEKIGGKGPYRVFIHSASPQIRLSILKDCDGNGKLCMDSKHIITGFCRRNGLYS